MVPDSLLSIPPIYSFVSGASSTTDCFIFSKIWTLRGSQLYVSSVAVFNSFLHTDYFAAFSVVVYLEATVVLPYPASVGIGWDPLFDEIFFGMEECKVQQPEQCSKGQLILLHIVVSK